MSEYRVEISRDAQNDMLVIYGYIRDELLNPSAAVKFLEDTDSAISGLGDFPYAHMVRPGSKLIEGVEKRQFPYRKSYCLFYIIKEDVKIVRVIKVSYSATNLDDE